MKKILSSFSMLFLFLLMLSFPAFAAEGDGALLYRAVHCEKDGTEYSCEGEYLRLDISGEGEICFNGEISPIQWRAEGDALYVVDAEGYELVAAYLSDGSVSGIYGGYSYVYVPESPDVSSETVPPADSTEESGEEDALCLAVLRAESCMENGTEYSCTGEYVVLNAGGSGMVVYDHCAYPISWDYDSETDALSFEDNAGNSFEGEMTEEGVFGRFHGYDYSFGYYDSAPIMRLMPERWGEGLPLLLDEAEILTAEQRKELSEKLEKIAEDYHCNVYIITMKDMSDYSESKSIETVSEELRVGYDLGCGADRDCLCLVLSMAQRDYDLCAFGEFAHRSFNDFGKEQLAKKFKEHFKEDDWYGGLKDYVEESGKYLKLSAEGKPVSIGTMPLTKLLGALISLLLGLLVSILAALWLRKKMISVSKESMAEQYLDMTGSEITHRSDRYTHTTENRVYDPPSSSGSFCSSSGSSRSSSGHSHSSGKF